VPGGSPTRQVVETQVRLDQARAQHVRRTEVAGEEPRTLRGSRPGRTACSKGSAVPSVLDGSVSSNPGGRSERW
jgi:hypothetical protein